MKTCNTHRQNYPVIQPDNNRSIEFQFKFLSISERSSIFIVFYPSIYESISVPGILVRISVLRNVFNVLNVIVFVYLFNLLLFCSLIY